jgi:hypothetical protein
MQARLQLKFAGADPGRLVERALAGGVLPTATPTSTKVDHARVTAAQALPALAEASADLAVVWADDARLHVRRSQDYLYIDREPWDLTVDSTLAMLRDWPFEACTTGSPDAAWWADYRSLHGWAFALKGRGHRLVSPRVIERGPWRLVRDAAAELTLFQFHALDVDEATALTQARPGHALLEPMWLGGHFAGYAWAFRGQAEAAGYKPSFYDKATRTSVVLVQDREVSPAEMGIAAATRIHQIFAEPVEQVAFVFTDEAAARRQLPALWLYGLEVRAMTRDGEQRIDLDYEPPPIVRPAWVGAGGR